MTVPTFIADYKANFINAQDVVGGLPDRRFRAAWVIDTNTEVITVEVKQAKKIAEDTLRREVRALAEKNTVGNRAAEILGEPAEPLPSKDYPAKLKAIKRAQSVGELEVILL